MLVVGIDPGLNGALVSVNSSGQPRSLSLIPTHGGDQGRNISLSSLSKIFEKLKSPNCLVVLEKPVAMQKSASTMKQGRVVGQIEGLLAAHAIPYYLVHPATWTCYFNKRTDKRPSKEKIFESFCKEFPHLKPWVLEKFNLKDREAIVDAAMIALWAVKIIRARGVEGLGAAQGLL